MRLSSLFEDFCSYLSVGRGCSPRTLVTYRKYFSYFLTFATTDVPGNAVLREHFTPELCRRYQYSMAQRGLEAASIRVRLAVLASFGKWSARRGKLSINQPVGYDDATEKEVQAAHGAAVDGGRDDPRPMLEAPGRGGRGPTGLRRPAAIRGRRARRGGLRRGLWPAQSDGQGGVRGRRRPARSGPNDSRRVPRAGAASREVRRASIPGAVQEMGREWQVRRMDSHRVWKLIKDMGRRAGIPEPHPHAFRHACAARLTGVPDGIRTRVSRLKIWGPGPG